MGAEVDARRGTVCAPLTMRLEVAYFALWFLGLGTAPTKVRPMVLGRLVHCFEFRRPLMTLLCTIWPKGTPLVGRPLSNSGAQELLRCIAMLPMAGAAVSNVVTCSDASETGGGLCASGSLTQEGHAVLKQLQSPEYRQERLLPFAAQGAMAKGPSDPALSWCDFDGIAALILMVALCRLECKWFVGDRPCLQQATLARSYGIGQRGEDHAV